MTTDNRPPAMAAVLFSELPSENGKPPRRIRGGFFICRLLG
jgi:hypothetical protein